MRSPRASLLLVLLGFGGVWLSSLGRPMPAEEHAEADPGWTLRLGHLLGPGRLLLRDVLWFRLMDDLETRPWRAQGEMEVLVKLSPHDVLAWRFLGWHLAFDVAPAAIDPQEKEAWITEAVQQLQQGLRYNPRSRELHYALARVLTPTRVLESYFAEPGQQEELALEHLEQASRKPGALTDDLRGALTLRAMILRRRAGRALLAGRNAESIEHWRQAAEVLRTLAEAERAAAEDLAPEAVLLTEAQAAYCRAWARLLADPGDAEARERVESFQGDAEREELLAALE